MTYSGASTLTAPDAYLLVAGRLSLAISHTTGGHTITQFSEDGRVGVTITSFGWTDDDLVRLATSIQADEHSVGFTDAWFQPDLALVSTVQPWLAVQSIPAEQISYMATGDPANNVVITVGQRLQLYEGGSADQRQIAMRFLLDPNTPFTVDGQQAVAGTIVGQGDRALATWISGDHVITVSANMPVSQLIDVARTVHQVSAREWDGMRFQAEHNQVSTTRATSTVLHTRWPAGPTPTPKSRWRLPSSAGSDRSVGRGAATAWPPRPPTWHRSTRWSTPITPTCWPICRATSPRQVS